MHGIFLICSLSIYWKETLIFFAHCRCLDIDFCWKIIWNFILITEKKTDILFCFHTPKMYWKLYGFSWNFLILPNQNLADTPPYERLWELQEIRSKKHAFFPFSQRCENVCWRGFVRPRRPKKKREKLQQAHQMHFEFVCESSSKTLGLTKGRFLFTFF